MTPQSSYSEQAKAGMSGRELEASALIKAAARMSSSLMPDSGEALGDALANNRKLWIFIASAVADDASPLPEPLRANILSLAAFVLRQSATLAQADAAAALPQLIAINREIAAGLRAV